MPSLDIPELLQRLDRALPARAGTLSLHEPGFQGREWEYLKDCLDTGWVSSVGQYVDRFEQMLADYTGAKHAIAVVNGTAALHACLLLAGVGRDDEVIIPSLTFIATANAVSYCGAVPLFADSSITTLGLDAAKLDAFLREHAQGTGDDCRNRRSGRRIAAVMPMHTFGHPVDIDALLAVCARYGLPLIEDAAESLGSFYHGRHTGNFGLLAGLSFNGNKVVTTGGGGAILTNDAELARRAKHLTTTARVAHRWSFIHDEVGYNYRMPNLNAALGCAQLEQLTGFLERKRALAARYDQALAGMPGLRFFRELPDTRSNYWLNTLLLDDAAAGERDAALQALNDHGLGARPVWTLMHRLPMYADCPRMDLTVAENLERRIINIPSSAVLG
jgi:perosamine synthetase